jgi:hypothetical protein
LKQRTGALLVLALLGSSRGETGAIRRVAALVPPPPGGDGAIVLLSSLAPDGRPAGPASLVAFERDPAMGGPPVRGDGVLDERRPVWSSSLATGARTRPALLAAPNNLFFFLDAVRGYPSFARTMQGRRRVLVVGGADGSVHGFDVGLHGEKGTGAGTFTFIPTGALSAPAPPLLEEPPSFDDAYVNAAWAGGGVACPAEVASGGRHCQWRTILAGGLGVAGRSVWALDVTKPDSNPMKLWELTDPALGFTFSAPRFGRVRLRNAATGRPEERAVVIFGGGWDPGRRTGNALFIVDAASGSVLFKTDRGFTRSASGGIVPLPFGPIPSAVTALDLDQDGFTDTVWFGDADGRLWKLTLPADDAHLATSEDGRVRDSGSDAAWRCVLALDMNPGAASAPEENAFTRPPAVVRMDLDPATSRPVHGIALATGNALDPSQRRDRGGRIVFLLDRPAARDGAVAPPTSFADLDRLAAAGSDVGCVSPGRPSGSAGWTLELPPGERADSDLLALGHELYFTAHRGGSGSPARYRLYRLRTESGAPCRGRSLDADFVSPPAAFTDARGHVRVTVAVETGGTIRLVNEAVPVQATFVNWGP